MHHLEVVSRSQVVGGCFFRGLLLFFLVYAFYTPSAQTHTTHTTIALLSTSGRAYCGIYAPQPPFLR